MKPWAVSRDETRQGYYKLSLVPNLSVIMAAKPLRSSFENFEGTTPHLPRFQVIEIKALSIRKNLDHGSGIDRCGIRVESHVFAGEEFEGKVIQIPMTKVDLFLRIFDFAAITLM